MGPSLSIVADGVRADAFPEPASPPEDPATVTAAPDRLPPDPVASAGPAAPTANTPPAPQTEPSDRDPAATPNTPADSGPPATAAPVEPPAESPRAEPDLPAEVPPPPVTPQDRYEFDEVDRPPAPLVTELPGYMPADPRRAREDRLDLRVLVDPAGRIAAVRIVDGIADGEVRRAAVGAILRWRFEPGSHRGSPVHVWVPVRLEYRLVDGEMRSVVTLSER